MDQLQLQPAMGNPTINKSMLILLMNMQGMHTVARHRQVTGDDTMVLNKMTDIVGMLRWMSIGKHDMMVMFEMNQFE
jgi:hypothetical protein